MPAGQANGKIMTGYFGGFPPPQLLEIVLWVGLAIKASSAGTGIISSTTYGATRLLTRVGGALYWKKYEEDGF